MTSYQYALPLSGSMEKDRVLINVISQLIYIADSIRSGGPVAV